MDLPFTMGTELTSINSLYNDDLISENWEFSNRFYDYMQNDILSIGRDLKRTHTSYYGLGTDGHCIEISSSKLKTLEEYTLFSKKTRTILANHGYFPKNSTAVCGGAHIHVGMNRSPWWSKFKWHVARDLVMRPYLPWIFGEPDEAGAMDVLINNKERFDYFKSNQNIDEIQWGYSKERFLSKLSNHYSNRGNYVDGSRELGKDYMFLLTYKNTIEFRFFEMAPTWEEQELQMNFLTAYMKWMVKRMDRNDHTEIKLMTDEEMQKVTPAECEACFEELCHQIRIPFDEYEVFIERNLYSRWKSGRKRV